MAKKLIDASALSSLLEQTSRGLHSLGYDHGLYPAQWSALRYFASMQPEHCSAIGLARYQGLAFGAVNRTVRTLITKKLLRKGGSLGKGRITRIELTRMGLNRLKHDPLQLMTDAVAELSAPEQQTLAVALEKLLRALHARHDGAHVPDDLQTLPSGAAASASTSSDSSKGLTKTLSAPQTLASDPAASMVKFGPPPVIAKTRSDG
jgi:DNA-binding MarR family transcriptional regulator